MNKRVKNGLVVLLLSSSFSMCSKAEIYSSKSNYSRVEESSVNNEQQDSRDDGFTSEGLVYTGLITLGAYYILKRFSKSKK